MFPYLCICLCITTWLRMLNIPRASIISNSVHDLVSKTHKMRYKNINIWNMAYGSIIPFTIDLLAFPCHCATFIGKPKIFLFQFYRYLILGTQSLLFMTLVLCANLVQHSSISPLKEHHVHFKLFTMKSLTDARTLVVTLTKHRGFDRLPNSFMITKLSIWPIPDSLSSQEKCEKKNLKYLLFITRYDILSNGQICSCRTINHVWHNNDYCRVPIRTKIA